MARDLLLHLCCGPCAVMPALRLREAGYNITGYFRNPNIQPLAEYLRRREAAIECAKRLDMELIIDDEWDLVAWLRRQLPAANAHNRCLWCCASRVEAARDKALSLGIPYFSTSLLYSPYQPHDWLASSGRELSTSSTVFVYEDFRVYFREGIEISKEWSLYRQPYCGCVFSENERYAKKLARLKNN
ncbi:MAG: epoxyqueuosine reductase QueH [Desulfovibrio sp.]|nr:epoxyqueuosine reductase QueH [Desulfovibrio sp.]